MLEAVDTAAARKARGAFFTPGLLTQFIARWAVRSADDRVLEPSAGDAAFLEAAVHRLRDLAPPYETRTPTVDGVEIHAASAALGERRVRAAGGAPNIRVSDFFLVDPAPVYDAVIGNPPYIRYQDFSGKARARSRQAALRLGVSLSGLASSWAAFTLHAASFLRDGGRLGLVLPAELLSVNYAAPVRRFLFEQFASVQLILFDEQVFAEAEADVVLLLAEGYREGSADHAVVRQARNAEGLATLTGGLTWRPSDPSAKWTASLVEAGAAEPLLALRDREQFVGLQAWGATRLGMVTGNNAFFTLSPERVRRLGLTRRDLRRVSPAGSSHLRGLALSDDMLTRLGRRGQGTYLFRPGTDPSSAARAYIAAGEAAGVDRAYKCRVRTPWYRVPMLEPADLLLTYMNADTPRLTTNQAGVLHLNSVHGLYLRDSHREVGRELLPVASLNSLTLLDAETTGRAYGGGVLKIEPREADVWAVPAPELVASRAAALRDVRSRVARLLQTGRLLAAVDLVDQALLVEPGLVSGDAIARVRQARAELARRRTTRGSSRGGSDGEGQGLGAVRSDRR